MYNAHSERGGLPVSQVVMQFKDVFEGEGMLMGKLHLQVDQCVPPVQLPARKPPVALKEKYQEELERLVERGIIAKVSEPIDWISSTEVVMKPNGKIRLWRGSIIPCQLSMICCLTYVKLESFQLWM